MADMTKPKKTTIRRKTVDTLERDDCRWPIGDPRDADFHFCGAPQLVGRPYCELHWRMAFQPMKSRTPSLPTASPSRRAA
jgi:GcrA cell cycle regulator